MSLKGSSKVPQKSLKLQCQICLYFTSIVASFFFGLLFLNNESNSSENCHTIKVSEKVCKETTFPLRSKVLVLILHDMLVIHFYFSAKLQVHEIFRCQIALKQATVFNKLMSLLQTLTDTILNSTIFRFSAFQFWNISNLSYYWKWHEWEKSSTLKMNSLQDVTRFDCGICT